MSERASTTGGPAYPIEAYITSGHMQAEGMTLRFRAALAAMQGILTADSTAVKMPNKVALQSFEIADAMIDRAKATDPEPYDISSEWRA